MKSPLAAANSTFIRSASSAPKKRAHVGEIGTEREHMMTLCTLTHMRFYA
jgi:hypothetical protein